MSKRKLMSYNEFLNTYGTSEINTLAHEYLKQGATQKSVSAMYNISVETFRDLVDFGISECHIQKDFINLMTEKSCRNQLRHYPKNASFTKPTSTETRFSNLEKDRYSYIHKYDEEIINLHYMIEAYNDFGFEEEGAIPKSALQARLDELEKRRSDLESF